MSTENITLCIRLGTSIRFTIPSSSSSSTITPSSTIQDVKNLIALEQACDFCPVERQRLIYKGRILSDDTRTLSDYGIVGDNQTLHLVKGSANRSTAPGGGSTPTAAPSSTPTPAPPAPAPTGTMPPPFAGAGGSNNMFATMQQMMQQNNGAPPSMAQMQQQLMSNPEMMNSLMSSPMMQSMMSNPDLMRSMMESNPEMRRVLDSNPQLRHILDDPELMRRSMEMMRDPSAMQNMMRNQDLAMSQIENVPGGFNALRRMYEEVQEPMMDAMAGGRGESPEDTPSGADTGGTAMPNPWGSPSPSSTAPSSSTSTPAANPFANANPWGLPTNPGSSPNPFQPTNPNNMNIEQTIQMLENPLISNMMQQVLSDPTAVQNMMDNNPMLAQMRQQNPAAAAMMSNPETLRAMMDPQNMRAMLQMQQAMQTLSGNMPGFPGIPNMGMPPAQQVEGGVPPVPNLDFSSLLTQFQNTSVSGSPSGGMRSTSTNPEERFRNQLNSLNDMGFTDREANIRALTATHGNVNRAVERLLGPEEDNTSPGNSGS